MALLCAARRLRRAARHRAAPRRDRVDRVPLEGRVQRRLVRRVDRARGSRPARRQEDQAACGGVARVRAHPGAGPAHSARGRTGAGGERHRQARAPVRRGAPLARHCADRSARHRPVPPVRVQALRHAGPGGGDDAGGTRPGEAARVRRRLRWRSAAVHDAGVPARSRVGARGPRRRAGQSVGRVVRVARGAGLFARASGPDTHRDHRRCRDDGDAHHVRSADQRRSAARGDHRRLRRQPRVQRGVPAPGRRLGAARPRLRAGASGDDHASAYRPSSRRWAPISWSSTARCARCSTRPNTAR